MDQKTIIINMAVTGPFPAQMAANGAAVQTFGAQANAGMAKATAATSKFGAIASKVGKVTILGIAAGLALSAKAAIDFESSFAGVKKTVDTTEAGFELLEDGIRRLATTIPIGVNELNRIAELGGQLGVDASGLTTFTETIAKIGVTTTLTTETAALGFARLDNVLQLNQQSFSNMGSAIVDLGNNFAATEDEILTFALRIAPIGATVGLAADEVLAIATAFTSVGVPAERGGTAIQKTFIKIAEAAMNGGDELQVFSETAGMTSDAFAELVATDPAAAFSAFITGLGRVRDEGGNVFAVLDKVELSNQRVISSLLAMAGAEGVLDEALTMSEEAWMENIALTEEAEKRFETTASRMTLAKNQIQDLAITLGQELLPALGEVADFIGDFIAGVDAMPDGFKSITLAAIGLVSGLALASAAVSKLSTALNIQLSPAMSGAGLRAIALRGLVGLGIAGAVAVGIAAFTQWGAKQADIKARTLGVVDALKQQKEGMDGLTASTIKNQLFSEGQVERLTKLGIGVDTFVEAIMGSESSIDIVTGKLDMFGAAGKDVADTISSLGGARMSALAPEDQEQLERYQEALAIREMLVGRTEEYGEAVKMVAREEQILAESAAADARARGIFPESQEIQDKMRMSGEQIINEYAAIYDQMAYVSEESLTDIEAALGDYTTFMRDAFSDTEDEIRGQINMWNEMGEAVVINVEDAIAEMQKQVTTQAKFFSILAQTPMSDTVRASYEGMTLEMQAGFVHLWETDRDGWERLVASQEEWLGPNGKIMATVWNAYGLQLPALIREGGMELVSAMKGVVDTMVAEEGADPAQAWIGVIQATLASAGPDLAPQVQEALYAAFGDGGIPGADKTLQEIYDIIAALGLIPTDIDVRVGITAHVDRLLANEAIHGASDPIPTIGTVQGPPRAFGGSVTAGMPYTVGERGSELFVPYTNGTIVPHNKVGGGGNSINLSFVVGSDSVIPDIQTALVVSGVADLVDLRKAGL